MKDATGLTILEGDTVVHCGAGYGYRSNYDVAQVLGFTPKMVKISSQKHAAQPNMLIVITGRRDP